LDHLDRLRAAVVLRERDIVSLDCVEIDGLASHADVVASLTEFSAMLTKLIRSTKVALD
jgi:hypothetical protein